MDDSLYMLNKKGYTLDKIYNVFSFLRNPENFKSKDGSRLIVNRTTYINLMSDRFPEHCRVINNHSNRDEIIHYYFQIARGYSRVVFSSDWTINRGRFITPTFYEFLEWCSINLPFVTHEKELISKLKDFHLENIFIQNLFSQFNSKSTIYLDFMRMFKKNETIEDLNSFTQFIFFVHKVIFGCDGLLQENKTSIKYRKKLISINSIKKGKPTLKRSISIQ